MKTNVIIAAYDEPGIGHALERLKKADDIIEPLVVVNGENNRAATVDAAAGFGIKVLQVEKQSKMRAIQEGLRSLGKLALNPVLFLDADSYPAFPRFWPAAMLRQLDDYEPSAVAGPFAYIDGKSKVDNGVRTIRRVQRSIDHRFNNKHRNDSLYGLNMGIHIQDIKVLDQVLELSEDVWPGEDRLLADTVSGGVGMYKQSLDPRAVVLTSARFHGPLTSRLKHGADHARQQVERCYSNRAAPDTRFKYVEGIYVPIESAQPQATRI